MSSTTQTVTEYGLKARSGSIEWPDEDGDLDLGPGYVHATGEVDVEALRQKAQREGYVLVKRLVTRTETAPEVVPSPLPTAFGSIIRATLPSGSRSRLTLADPQDAGMEWWAERGEWVAASSLSEIEVLFDAKEVAA